MQPVSVGTVVAIVVLIFAAILGYQHDISRDVALLVGALAVARLT